MQFFKKIFFALVWSVIFLLVTTITISIFNIPSVMKDLNTSKSSSFQESYQEGYNSGHQKGYETGQKYAIYILLGPIIAGFGGSFLGLLPGTRKKKVQKDEYNKTLEDK